MTENLAATYCSCMEDVKSRLTVVRSVIKGQLSTGHAVGRGTSVNK